MGFIKEVYSNNRAGLVVVFGRGETSEKYFNGDSVEEAMKHFNMYLHNNEIFIRSEDSVALENLNINAEDATEFRATVDAILTTLTDEQAIQAPILFPIWQPNIEYKVGDRIRYENKLYKVIQEHTSEPTWLPINASSLYASLLTDEENNKVLEWIQPESTNGYMTGDQVMHNDILYVSTADNNIWEPGTVGAPWEAKIEKEEEQDNPEISQWTPNFSYMIGDRIMYENIEYESLIDNNVWSPIDYPAGWVVIE